MDFSHKPHHKSSPRTLRKEIRAAEDRLRRQIESDRKDEAMAQWICVEIDSGNSVSWESKEPPEKLPPPINKALLRDY